MKAGETIRVMALVLGVAAAWLPAAMAGESGSKAQDFETLLTRARTSVNAGQLDTAEKLYRQALSLKPGHPEARYELGTCYLDMGRCYDARRSFRMAMSARTGDGTWEGRCRIAIARTWELSRDSEQALREYQLALAADSTLAEARAASERLRAEID